jgi:S-adenosylmethionine:tRNA-ribosyltransferase-isomerase (queuine synthetase)
MSNVAEFIEVRKSIETLARQITLSVEQHTVQNSKQHLDEANRQLEVLKAMVDNDVQVIVAGRLSRQLTGLGTKVESVLSKLPASKRLAAGKKPAAKKPAGKKLKTAAITVSAEPLEVAEIVIFERP